MWIQTILSSIFAYLFGSFPSAYLLVKWRYHKRVTEEGSGNVGTFNALRTTKSKPLSAAVLLLDFLKGATAVYLGKYLFSVSPEQLGFMAVFVVLGHNYTIWLGFKGGRGLATSAGVAAVIAPFFLLIWLIGWALFYLFRRQIIYASVFATVLTPVFLWWPNDKFAPGEIATSFTIICVLIIIKHIPRLKDGLLNRPVKPSG